jgi:hypothetical protein
MSSDSTADFILQTLGREVIKVKKFYDGSNRVTSQYEAVANAEHGKPCLKTEYTYVGATPNVDAMKESAATWDSAWDI